MIIGTFSASELTTNPAQATVLPTATQGPVPNLVITLVKTSPVGKDKISVASNIKASKSLQ